MTRVKKMHGWVKKLHVNRLWGLLHNHYLRSQLTQIILYLIYAGTNNSSEEDFSRERSAKLRWLNTPFDSVNFFSVTLSLN